MADDSYDSAPPFLPSAPVPWIARGLAYLMIALAVAGVLGAIVIQIPEIVSSPFVLVPLRGTDPVRAPRDGVVSEVRAVEGQTVGVHAPLFVIRSSVVGDRSAELRALETQLTGDGQRRANETLKYESQRRADDEEERRLQDRLDYLSRKIDEQTELRTTRDARFRSTLSIYENEIEITKREIDFKRQHASVAKELADRTEKLYRDGLMSWMEYTNRQLEARKLAVDLEQLDKQLESARLKVAQLKFEDQQERIEWKLTQDQLATERRETATSLEKLRYEAATRRTAFGELDRSLKEEMDKAAIRIAALRKDLDQSSGNEVAVPAPCAGTVLRLRAQAAGAVVHDGDTLGELACTEGRLQAELSVPPSGVGLIKPGYGVKLLYDTFPYQRYGVRRATVRWVSPASVAVNEARVFRVFADLEDDAIQVKGERRPLSAGMGGRADVVVGRRPLITYAFEPLRQLRESFADAPASRTPRPGPTAP